MNSVRRRKMILLQMQLDAMLHRDDLIRRWDLIRRVAGEYIDRSIALQEIADGEGV